ncbi:MAG: helix-turn-helix domain-containing protein [Oscillospiraceae bacterium]|nr:helix-turn-helix domain-containing protein [Oscillospiraceae bacterium]
MNKVAFGAQIRRARKERDVTAKELSEMCGLRDTFIRQLECGSNTPSVKTLVSICNALKVSPNFLLSDSLDDECGKPHNNVLEKLRAISPGQISAISAILDAITVNNG